MRRLHFAIIVLLTGIMIAGCQAAPPKVGYPIDSSWGSYTSYGLGPAFRIRHPRGWTVIEGPAVQQVNRYVGMPVVKLATPPGFQAGTNFSEASVTVSQSSAAADVASCTAQAQAGQVLPLAQSRTIGGATWNFATSSGAAAGNRYDQTMYRTVRAQTCLELLTTIHSGNLGSYDPGTVQAFNRPQVSDLLEQITSSFVFLEP